MNLVFLAAVFLLPMTVTFWAIVHVLAKAEFDNPLARYGWLAVVALLPVVGALIYLAAGLVAGNVWRRSPRNPAI